jgi:phage terminase small subunit
VAARKRPARGAKKPARTAKGRAVTTRVDKVKARLEVFIREYLVDFNGRRAAIAAGYSADSARQTASEMLATPDVQAKLQEAIAQRAQVSGITAKAVVDRLHAIATADPRELIELHRACCRYCWGRDHLYQRTRRELAAELATRAEQEKAKKEGTALPPFEDGGIGYNPKRDPNPDCPECFGEGVERVVAKDTRDLSPAARMLYAGVKTTQHGLEIKMHDQTGMLVNLGKHLGLFRDKVELTGKDGGPIEHSLREIIDAVEGADTGIGPAAGRRG